MGGKYEIRYWIDNPTEDNIYPYNTIYTNSWFEYIRLRLTKKVIYYLVRS